MQRCRLVGGLRLGSPRRSLAGSWVARIVVGVVPCGCAGLGLGCGLFAGWGDGCCEARAPLVGESEPMLGSSGFDVVGFCVSAGTDEAAIIDGAGDGCVVKIVG